jgi:hypothetical protein
MPALFDLPSWPEMFGHSYVTHLVDDFQWSFRGVRVKKTGAFVPFDHAHLSEIVNWILFFFAVVTTPRLQNGPVIGFAPDPARPWYLIWPVLLLAGGRAAKPGETPDLWMHFNDQTKSPDTALPHDHKPRWNFDALDLSKSAVASAFETAFGYSLALDPTTGEGVCVEKGEANGVHDGQIVALPCQKRPGKVYQRLIDNRGVDGLVEDLRTPTIGGRPACVYIKRRPVERRFTNDNIACDLQPVEAVFSPEEVAAIERFCAILKLDWGGLDILRDAQSGLIYIVDANRTDMGPPIALSLRDKIESTKTLAQLLRVQVAQVQNKANGA